MSTEAKKPRAMSLKGWLHKSSTKAANSAVGFLAQHRSFLETGEVAEFTSPILRQLDDGHLMPTPALELLKHAVLSHLILAETRKAERALDAQLAVSEEGEAPSPAEKSWRVAVYNDKNELQTKVNSKGEIEDLEQSFEASARASGWADRRLFDGASDWHAAILHLPTGRIEIILRADAMARIMRQKKGPTCHTPGKGTQKLSFGTKVKETRVTFSHG